MRVLIVPKLATADPRSPRCDGDRLSAEDAEEFAPLERGWCVGSEEFRKKLLSQANAGPEHYGQEIRESGEQKARRRVKDELKNLGWSESDLLDRPKGDPEKLRIATALRRKRQ